MNRSISRKLTVRLFFRQLFGYAVLDAVIVVAVVAALILTFGIVEYNRATWYGQFAGHLVSGQIRFSSLDLGIVRIMLPGENQYYYLGLVIVTMAPICVVQLVMLITHAVKNNRMARYTLGSLDDLARAADSLNRTVTGEPKPTLTGVQSLAGQLGSIDAERLDRRINISAEHKELRELAIAINGMLDRIDAAYRAQAQFVSDASHELRTPISVIQGYANLLDRWGKGDSKTLQESITAIKNETANMKDLVEQLLFLARGDSDSITLEPTEFDLAALAAEVVEETSMIDTAHSLDLKTNPVSVVADRGLIKQAVRILVDNSVKYTDASGQITVSCSGDVSTGAPMARISVGDNGIGIAPDVLPHIFERFTRADASRARATGGAGLGLAIAKWIVTRHAGRLEALSREGIGTRMTILLPMGNV